jgi:hypothetical protein
MLLLILLVVLILAFGGGVYGHSTYGYRGWSPFGIIIVILVILFFMGRIRF